MADITKEEMRERLGNIDQIRDLLFGHKIQEYDQRFEKCEERLEKIESELSGFQLEMCDHLTQLQDSLSTEIRSAVDSLEKKLKYLSLTTNEKTSKLQQKIDLTDEKNSHNIESLQKTVTDQTTLLKNELSKTRDKLEEDIQALRNQAFEEIGKGLSNLKDAKVSRADLAEILFELCLKIKGTEFVPDLKEAAENKVKTEPRPSWELEFLPQGFSEQGGSEKIKLS
ncbi:MAG: hypothetical protein AB4426_29860 [Xenococcaceae cyanobacterium]